MSKLQFFLYMFGLLDNHPSLKVGDIMIINIGL